MTGINVLKNQDIFLKSSTVIQKQSSKSRVKFIYNDYHEKKEELNID